MTFITPLDGRVLMWANDVGAILVAEGPNAGKVVAMLPPLPDPLLRTEFPTTGSVQVKGFAWCPGRAQSARGCTLQL
jgi:hypothetical protein